MEVNGAPAAVLPTRLSRPRGDAKSHFRTRFGVCAGRWPGRLPVSCLRRVSDQLLPAAQGRRTRLGSPGPGSSRAAPAAGLWWLSGVVRTLRETLRSFFPGSLVLCVLQPRLRCGLGPCSLARGCGSHGPLGLAYSVPPARTPFSVRPPRGWSGSGWGPSSHQAQQNPPLPPLPPAPRGVLSVVPVKRGDEKGGVGDREPEDAGQGLFRVCGVHCHLLSYGVTSLSGWQIAPVHPVPMGVWGL